MEAKILCPYCMGEITAGARSCPRCQRSLINRNPAGALPFGTLLAGRYTIGEMLSVDGEGVLYRGVENKGAFRVTVKEYLPITLAAERGPDFQLRPKPGSEVLFKTTRMDFAELYRAVQRITPATGLEAVLDVFEENNTVYAVMENPGGKPLRQWLLEHGSRVRAAEACTMLQPVFNGVAAMHQVGLVHRGISPENIRVLENGRARLTGYATIGLRTAGSGLHEQLYEGYSAPEQYSSAEFEGRYTDEYGLAAVFYRMVCGQSPVPAAQRLVSDSNPSARTVEPSVPGYVSDVLELGLRLKPAERIQTVPQLMRALTSPEAAEELVKKVAAGRKAAAAEDTRERNSMWLKSMFGAILLLLTVLLLLTLWGLLGRQSGESTEPAAPPESVASSVEAVEVRYVPDFVGLIYAQVQNSQKYTSHYLFRVTQEYSDTAPAGVIIRQEPAAGTIMDEEEDTIQLVISMGPEQVEMPDIIGLQKEDAVELVRSYGLGASCYPISNNGSYEAGSVVSCDPIPGTMVEVGTNIIIYVASEQNMPELSPSSSPVPEDGTSTPPPEGLVPGEDVDTD